MEVLKNKIYRHYKGNYYIVEDIAIDSETLEKVVVYRALYDDNKLWTRPYNDFIAKVENKDQEHRFELVELPNNTN